MITCWIVILGERSGTDNEENNQESYGTGCKGW